MKVTNSNRVFNNTEVDALRQQAWIAETKLEYSRATNAAWLAIPSGLFAAGHFLAIQAAAIHVLSGFLGNVWLAGAACVLGQLWAERAARHIKAARIRLVAANEAMRRLDQLQADDVRGS